MYDARYKQLTPFERLWKDVPGMDTQKATFVLRSNRFLMAAGRPCYLATWDALVPMFPCFNVAGLHEIAGYDRGSAQ
jgi:hypothetical protein